jgi:outer membrane protein assembly factor BamB
MKILKNEKTAIAAIVALILVTSTAITLLPNATAHTPPWTIVSYAYISVAPNPIGVGQTAAVCMWVDTPMPSAAIGNDIRRHDYTLTISKPDGTKLTQQWDIVYDTTGVQFFRYTPDQVGTYTFNFNYGGQTYTWNETSSMRTYTGDIFPPASSTATLTVQTAQLPTPIDSYPLPTEYWTRPIEAQNTYWYAISSNWLGEPYITSGVAIGGGTSGNYFGRIQPDGIAPNSAHIMWSKPIQDGGIAGGNTIGYPGKAYYTGSSYNPRFSNALIMYGRLYYQEPYGNSGGGGDYVCVDLRTGQELWREDVSEGGVPSFGYLYANDNPNQAGILPNGLLFTNNFARAYDPATGKLTTMNVTNVPRTDTLQAAVVGPQGEILRYTLTNVGTSASPNWYLTQWNSSRAIGGSGGTGVSNWYSGTVNASQPSCFDWNTSISLPGTGWRVDRADLDNIMLLVQGSFGAHVSVIGATPTEDGANVTAVSLKPKSLGTVLWTKNFPPAPGNVTRAISNWDPDNGVFVMSDKETRVMNGFSLTDGNKIWGPTEPANVWTYFRAMPAVAYGKIYFAGYGGTLYCFDVKSGELLWTYGNGGPGNSTSAGLETPYGTYPIFIDVIADGKVFLATTEHSISSNYKDAQIRAINATDGTEVWTLMGWGTGMDATYDRVADGFFVYLNTYDMQIYTVGKGPSQLTISAPDIASTLGTQVVIKGTVTDIAEGTNQAEQSARFPNGVPAVSDQSMNKWMEYVYMQKPKPADTVGVPVHVTAIDPNGNYQDVGTVNSDASGTFAIMWNPPVPGLYTITAQFEGSESYWPSQATTYFGVTEASPANPIITPTPLPTTTPSNPTAPPQTQTPTETTAQPSPTSAIPPASGEPTTTYIAIGAAVVIIVAAAAALVIRKRQKQ